MRQMSGIAVPFMREIDIDDRAARCRRRLAPGIAAETAVDMQQVLEDFDGSDVPLPDGTNAKVAFGVDRTLPNNVLGLTSFNKSSSTIHVDFNDHSYAAMETEGWARFTAAHEIGHVKLHLEQLVTMTMLPHAQLALARASHLHSLACDSEIQANRFAAAFMAPDDGLKILLRDGVLDVDTVMSVFGMSRSAAFHRIQNYYSAIGFRDREDATTRRKGGR